MKIAMLVFDGVFFADVLPPMYIFDEAVDILSGRDRPAASRVEVTLVEVGSGAKSKAPVPFRFGFQKLPHRLQAETIRLDACGPETRFDVLIVPGGTGLAPLAERDDVGRFLRAQAAHLTHLCSVCGGAVLLAHLGFLDGRRFTSNPGRFEEIARIMAGRGATHEIVEAAVVDAGPINQGGNGRILTAGAVFRGVDLALRLVEEHFGSEVRDEIVETLQYLPPQQGEGGATSIPLGSSLPPVRKSTARPRKTLALVNGRVHTDARSPAQEAILLDGQTIAEVGTTAEVMRTCRDRHGEEIDLGGRVVLPGFNDSHMHLLSFARSLDTVDLRDASSIARLIQLCKAQSASAAVAPGSWLFGRGWTEQRLGGAAPTAADLDHISSTRPIMLERHCSHVAVVNSAGLEFLRQGPLPAELWGDVPRNARGERGGTVRETALEWLRERLLKSNAAEIRSLLRRGASVAAAAGLTSVQTDDLGAAGGDWETVLDAYRSLEVDGELPVRINLQLLVTEPKRLETLLAHGLRTGDGSTRFRIGPIKMLTDGSLGARTAAVREPYDDDASTSGQLNLEPDLLAALVRTSHQAGMQVALHAIGDRALEQSLNAIEAAAGSRIEEIRAARHRIIHCQIGDLPLYDRMARLGVVADVQPSFVASDWSTVAKRLGEKRAAQSYAWRTLVDRGVMVAGSSDCPIESLEPLVGIHAAVTRQQADGTPAGGWRPEEKLDVAGAIELFTKNSAYSSFEEHIKGTLVPGQLADLVVLDGDPFDVAPEALKDLTIAMTICGGVPSYVSTSFGS